MNDVVFSICPYRKVKPETKLKQSEWFLLRGKVMIAIFVNDDQR